MDFGFPRTRGDALRICPVEAYFNPTPSQGGESRLAYDYFRFVR